MLSPIARRWRERVYEGKFGTSYTAERRMKAQALLIKLRVSKPRIKAAGDAAEA
jgi:hypothetical protein